jgi:glucokinase
MTTGELCSHSVIAVDIGGTSTKAAILEPNGELKFVQSIPTLPDAQNYFQTLVELIRRVREHAAETSAQSIKELGVAVAGFLDEERSRLIYNPNVSWLENFPLRERIDEVFPDLRIELEVDSNAATMAEYRLGSGRGTRRFLCVTCGTGLGVGMTVNGSPLRFAYGCLGDIGHVIVDRNGPRCTCGGRGCAEAMIGAPMLAIRFREITHVDEVVTLQAIIERAKAGDPSATEVIAQAGEWLGIALASIANMLFPDHIAIAGGLSAAGDLLITAADRVFREVASVKARHRTRLARATLGPLAPLVGAAWPFWQ